MKRLAVLASGRGSNLQSIIDAINSGEIKDAEIAVIISNNKDAYALERAKESNIKSKFVDAKDFENKVKYDEELSKIIKENNADLVILAGYIKILTKEFVEQFPNKIINIHPALLPKHGGKGMYGKYVHEAVLKSGDSESGCTAHFVTAEVDEGPIISQAKVPVLPNDTVDTLAKRVLAEEHKLFIQAIKSVISKETSKL